MKKVICLAFLASLMSISALGQSATSTPGAKPGFSVYKRPNAEQRAKNYIKSMFGAGALAGTIAGAGFGTAFDNPEEWPSNWNGFGKRAASSFGRNVIRSTVAYSLDEAFKVDSKFYRSENRRMGSRIKNALLSSVTARKPNGRRTVGVPRIAGAFAASFVADRTWMPGDRDWKDSMRGGAISLGTNSLVNIFRELFSR